MISASYEFLARSSREVLMAPVACNIGSSVSFHGIRVTRLFLKNYGIDDFSSSVSSVSYRSRNSGFSFHIGSSLLSSHWNSIPRASRTADGNSEQSVISDDGKNDASASERLVVLVIGGGGREHALCYALKRSPSCEAVFCSPGNAGIAHSGDATCISDLNIMDGAAVISFCHTWGVGLVVVGPEAPHVAGLVNDLVWTGILTFDPSSEAATLEGSKDFMKKLCNKYGIHTCKYI